MGLLQKIKSVLGFDGTHSPTSSGSDGHSDVDVTVEREPSTESEDAVKGTDTSAAGAEPEPGDADVSEPAADADEPDEELGDERAEVRGDEQVEDSDAVAAEPEGDADAETDDEDVGDADAETDDEDVGDADAETAEPAVDFEGADDPVTEIKGIGPAYAERLTGLGIETVGDLAVADAADVAAQTDLAETRVAGWIERANEY